MKSFLLAGLAILAIGAITGGAIFLFQKQSQVSPKPETQEETAPEVVPAKTLRDYADPSGFTLQYPDDVSVTAKEATDAATYADVEFTSKKFRGGVSINIVDSKLKSLDEWAKGKDIIVGTSKEATLGEMKAREIKNEDAIILGALDQGVLFTVRVKFGDGKEFWQSVYDTLVSSFAFAAPQAPATSGSGSSGSSSDIIFEGEEVVE